MRYSRKVRAAKWREAARRFVEHGTQRTAEWWFREVGASLRSEMFDVYMAHFYPVAQRGYTPELRAMVCLMCAAITEPPGSGASGTPTTEAT